MKQVWQLIPVVLVLCVAAILVMKTSSSPSSSQHCNRELSFSPPLLLFLVFNTLVVTLIIGSHKSPANEDGKGMPFSCSFYGVGSVYDDAGTILEENYEEEDDEDDGDGDGCASDGYYEDDDDNGTDDDDNDDWDDYRNEYDESLERRIEDFIAKVNEGWREERLMKDRRKAQKVIGKELSVSSYSCKP